MTAVGSLDALWIEFRQTRDEGIRRRLLLTYAPLVKYVADRLATGLPVEIEQRDIVASGLVGLSNAIERYDPDRGVAFEAYATQRVRGWIIGDLHERRWVSSGVRARAKEIERAMADLERELRRDPGDDEIAASLGISDDELDASLTEISKSGVLGLDEDWGGPHSLCSRPQAASWLHG
jgi:RNA polymerase sigma factor for flagellar operon FliA